MSGEFWRLEQVSKHELYIGLREALGGGTHTEATIVAYLSAIAERRLYLEDGFSSMFKFCQRRHAMSEGEAFLRLNAAKLARRFPILFEMIATRAIHLSALRLLRKHLTQDNHLELIREASGRTKLEVLEMLARRFPRASIEPSLRKLPATQPGAGALRSDDEGPPQHLAELLPVSEDRYRLQLDMSRRFKEKLDLAKALGSHANPRGDIEVILEQALDLWLEKLRNRRFARTTRPPTKQGPKIELSAKSKARRPIARAVVREVTERDGMQCSYVSPDGQRCGAQAFLQLHHEVAWARHGSDGADNLTWLCSAHNQFLAEKEFGHEHMAQFKEGGPLDPGQVK